MRQTRRRGLLVAAMIGAISIGTVTAASAFWAGNGSGSGSGATRTAQPVTLSPATAAASLYPGGQTPVELTVTNPNPGGVRVVSLALDTGQGSGGFAVDAGHAGCVLSTLSFATQTNGGVGWTIPTGSAPVTLPGSLSMSTSAANACQGASFTVYLRVGP